MKRRSRVRRCRSGEERIVRPPFKLARRFAVEAALILLIVGLLAALWLPVFFAAGD